MTVFRNQASEGVIKLETSGERSHSVWLVSLQGEEIRAETPAKCGRVAEKSREEAAGGRPRRAERRPWEEPKLPAPSSWITASSTWGIRFYCFCRPFWGIRCGNSSKLVPLVLVQSLGRDQLFRGPVDRSPPDSSVHGFPRQEGCSGSPCLSPGGLPNPGIESHISCPGRRILYCWATGESKSISRSVVSDSATPWTVACQASLSMEFSSKNTGVGCHSLLQQQLTGSSFCRSYPATAPTTALLVPPAKDARFSG